MQELDDRSDLFANRRAQDSVSGIEALSGYHPARNFIRAQQLASGGSEHAKAPRAQFVPGEVAVAAVDASGPIIRDLPRSVPYGNGRACTPTR